MIVKVLRQEKIGGLRLEPGLRDLPEVVARLAIEAGSAELPGACDTLQDNGMPARYADRDVLIRMGE